MPFCFYLLQISIKVLMFTSEWRPSGQLMNENVLCTRIVSLFTSLNWIRAISSLMFWRSSYSSVSISGEFGAFECWFCCACTKILFFKLASVRYL